MKYYINFLLLNTQRVWPLVSGEKPAQQAFPFCFGAKLGPRKGLSRAVFDSRSSLFAPAETTRKRLLGRLSGEHSLRVHL